MNEKIHIGEYIRKQLHREERSIIWLAGKLNYDRTNIYRLLKKPSLDTHLLLRISKILNHDFFTYYSRYLQND